ncbi:helix-turn-helix transcriptional regulator [Oceanobacillus jeddahense]|uniref:helix-turn-helix transcriptional regulator n=1 Tax=Oceanobacillus jeddahense TaxID=1462527 RepID=UPI0006938358|nr:AraC family transcriptional regulator [Oceanobacillus jeddahense]
MRINKITTAMERIEEVDFRLVNQLQILFVVKGYLEMMHNGSSVFIRTGEIFLLNKGDIIHLVGSRENATLILKFEENTYQEELPLFQLSRPLSPVYRKDAYEQIKNCFVSLYIEANYPAEGSEYMIEGNMNRLIGLFYRNLKKKVELESHVISDKVKEMVSYINHYYEQELSLDKLAAHFFSSKYYLAHEFKNQLGISIGQYIKEVRLFHSVRMLVNSNEKIVTIALANGFPNVRSFSEEFKKRYHVTPKKYRELQQEGKGHHMDDDTLSEDVVSLLSPYMSVEEFSGAGPIQPTSYEVEVDVNKEIYRRNTLHSLLKIKPEHMGRHLSEIHHRIGIEWVAVTSIIKKLAIKQSGGELHVFFDELDRVLRQILSAGMIPYIQLQTIDFDDWQQIEGVSVNGFPEVLVKLKYHLQQNYLSHDRWGYEFRCFYEFKNRGELCSPLVKVISIFQDYPNLVIHFPKHPESAAQPKEKDNLKVYCIDDLTSIKKISFDEALIHLTDLTHIETISGNKNIKGQHFILENMLDFEKDDYLQKYADLAQANAGVLQYMRQAKQAEKEVFYFSPVSADGEKLFEYFPEELANKISLCTADGRYKDNWYANEFMKSLFENVVFQNEACIVTRQQENYRILAAYPEEEYQMFMNWVNKEWQHTKLKKTKSPSIYIKLDLLPIQGKYRLVKQELTTDLIDQRVELEELKNSEKLSFEDIRYWNGINRPRRHVETVSIKGKHSLEVEVSFLGIVMVNLEKIQD